MARASFLLGGLAMKPVVVIGIILIVLGVVALVWQGISYTTTERVVDLGPLKVDAKKEKTIPLPPVLGVIALAGGIVLVALGSRR
jgi:hypothetical protein